MSRSNLAPVPRAVVRRLENTPPDQGAAWSALWRRLLTPRPPGNERAAEGKSAAGTEGR